MARRRITSRAPVRASSLVVGVQQGGAGGAPAQQRRCGCAAPSGRRPPRRRTAGRRCRRPGRGSCAGRTGRPAAAADPRARTPPPPGRAAAALSRRTPLPSSRTCLLRPAHRHLDVDAPGRAPPASTSAASWASGACQRDQLGRGAGAERAELDQVVGGLEQVGLALAVVPEEHRGPGPGLQRQRRQVAPAAARAAGRRTGRLGPAGRAHSRIGMMTPR